MADLTAIFNTSDPTVPGAYKPSQTALLLLDYHELFVNKMGGSAAKEATAVAVEFRKWAKSQGMPIIHGILDLEKPPYPTCKDYDRFNSIATAMRQPGGQGEEHPALLEGEDEEDLTFLRILGHVSALKSPGIMEYFEKKGIKSLILTGLSTSGCVLRTCNATTDAEFVTTVISDACADPAEGVHDMMVNKVLNNRAYVVTAKEFQENYKPKA